MRAYFIKFYDKQNLKVDEEMFSWKPKRNEIELYMSKWPDRVRYSVASWPIVDPAKFQKICATKTKRA